MATVSFIRTTEQGRCYRHTWSPLLQGDDGQATKIPGASDRTVQILGTFGGATVTFEASVLESPSVAADFFTVTDVQGNAVSLTSAGAELVVENAVFYRPLVTGGDGTTSITVHLLSRTTR